MHGEHGVDRGCDLGWPLVLVEVGLDQLYALAVPGQSGAGALEQGRGEVDAGIGGGQGVQQLCGQLAIARCQFDHLRVEDGQRVDMRYDMLCDFGA